MSRVMREDPGVRAETRERVLGVIRDLGYVPNPQARALALRTNFLIGLIHDNPNAQMVLNVQQGILEALQGSEFEGERLEFRAQGLDSSGVLRSARDVAVREHAHLAPPPLPFSL
mgnify:CR=1 FL=1